MRLAANKLKERHEASLRKLKEIAEKKFKNSKKSMICGQVAAELNTTGQTVINYVNGNCARKDGFFTEALIEEFKKI